MTQVRKLLREDLPKRTLNYLAKKQAEVAAGRDVNTIWKYARQTKTLQGIVIVLRRMVGTRNRCMFCQDSRGTTIEHFWPKAVHLYPEKTFVWTNLLLLCQGCQNHKGDRFDLDMGNQPLLIDPTAEDPWDYLFFESRTGIMTAKVDSETGLPDPKGEHTTDPRVLPLNIEAITEGRRRTVCSLRRAIERFFREVEAGTEPSAAQSELLESIGDYDDYGLVTWFFLKDGRDESPFRDLMIAHPDVWRALVEAHPH